MIGFCSFVNLASPILICIFDDSEKSILLKVQLRVKMLGEVFFRNSFANRKLLNDCKERAKTSITVKLLRAIDDGQFFFATLVSFQIFKPLFNRGQFSKDFFTHFFITYLREFQRIGEPQKERDCTGRRRRSLEPSGCLCL